MSGLRSAAAAALTILVLGTPALAAPADEQTFDSELKPLLTAYCVSCHGKQKPKGERRFDDLSPQIRNDDEQVAFQEMLDQLNLGAMPPDEAKQPPVELRRRAIAWLTARIAAYHQSRRSQPRPVLRRLNAREYRNTIRDLLLLNMTMFDPTREFPRDQTAEHLDTIGETLVTSGPLLAKYLAAADVCVEKAIQPPARPVPRTWEFRDDFRQQPEIDQVHRKTNRFEHMTLYDVVGADKHEGAYGPILAFRDGVPRDGVYEIRLLAEAVNRLHPYDPEFLGTDRDEPLRLGIVAGNYRAGALHKPQPVEPLLAELDLADQRKWYTVRVWLDEGYTPRFTFRNGLMDVRSLWSRLLNKYKDQFPKRKSRGIVEARFNAIKYGKLPQIHIHEIEIRGPLLESWPTPSQRRLLGDDCRTILAGGEMSDEQIRDRLRAFVSRAFRRPARAAEVDRVMQVVRARRNQGRTGLEAFADGLKTVLCSPHFLYLAAPHAAKKDAGREDEREPKDEADAYALAARLSYFLWSSTPDDELTRLAAAGKLRQAKVLAEQVDRLLDDTRSDAFVDGFLGSWLTLRDLGATPPDRARFRDFYHYDLDAAMRRETHLFTRHLLAENLSIGNFLDSDFAFVNKPLARLYGIQPPDEPGFRRVALTDRRRGGLLGQASVLTVTANGIDTSPVVRGVWLLENILGTPPSPPPDDVEPLDPDIRGAKTIREQLKKHRQLASCLDCHRKIDPLGFALENFDPVGGWRGSYPRQGPVDASGELPGGLKFDDIQGLKRILVTQRKQQFASALTSKLLAYGTGRAPAAADRPGIDRIVADLQKPGDGFRDLIKRVVLSDLFRGRD